jgi:hypothetical protein
MEWKEVKTMNLFNKTMTALTVSGMALLAGAAAAQEITNEGPVPTSALISVNSKHDVQLDPAMLKLQVNRHDSPITAVTPVTPKNLQIAILIDDGLRGSFSLQLNEVKSFLTELPPGTQTLVGYMQNGTVRTKGFSTNHEEVANDLRVPMSIGGISASPYFALSDFVKNWPSNQPGSRIVLLITNGIDPYNGRPSVLNQDSPYVQTAQDDAQRAGVAVYSIYYPDAGMRGGSFSGQSYLSQVAEATGGQSFYNGTIPPVSFKPYLEQFRKAIFESYTVSFRASATKEKRDTLTQIKVSTTQPGVKIVAPAAVHPGVTQ